MKIKLMTDAPKHNLALMKISSFHKSKGDHVFIGKPLDDCDLSYASWLFSETSYADISGGIGSSHPETRLNEMNNCRPDYSLYNLNYSLGYTWEWCFRGCEFEYELGKYGCPNCCGDYTAHYEYEYTLRRHRLFECSFGTILPPASCNHLGKALPVYGHAGGSSKCDGLKFPGVESWREGMQITWMNQKELSEAIPPAFTEYIGKYLMEAVKNNIG